MRTIPLVQRVAVVLAAVGSVMGASSSAAAGQALARSSAVAVTADDATASQLAAAGRYQAGDFMGALVVWNRAGEPRIDSTVIRRAGRTRPSVVFRAIGLQPRALLTPDAFARALRRLRDLPVVSTADMSYDPVDGGLARVALAIKERHVVPSSWGSLGTVGVRAAFLHELKIDVAGPTGAGELAIATWRWSAGRPRVALALAIPSPVWFTGNVTFDGSWERQSYDSTTASDPSVLREERQHFGLHVADWSSGSLRWQAGTAFDRLPGYAEAGATPPGTRDYFAVDSSIDARFDGDRIALVLSGSTWTPFAGGSRFGTAAVMAAWRSTDLTTTPAWSAVTGFDVASGIAPLALWQGAGTGQGRPALLRAHPLLTTGVLTGEVFGRQVAHASMEYARPVGHMPAGGVAIAGFVDTAQAWQRRNGLGTSPLFVDAGVGLRMHAPGPGGAIRVDVAHGLRGGGTTLSAGWGGTWPR